MNAPVNETVTHDISLRLLSLSPLNVRKTTDEKALAKLAANIEQNGLLQNLVVYKDPKNKDGYLVVAGGRRLAALRMANADAGLLIPCKVVSMEEAEEISLAENYHREPMHPADEFEAFQHLVTKNKRTPLEVAQRFGVDELHVKRMLKLANVSPAILKMFRENDAMTLDQVMALAVTDDHDRQLKVWNGARSHWQQEPKALRDAMTAGRISTKTNLGKFVGVEAYEAAGGAPESDLFSDEVFLPDAGLVNKLASEKLEKRAAQLRKQGWSWVEVHSNFSYEDKRKFKQAEREYKGGKQLPWSDKVKGYAGAVVSVDSHNGKISVDEGLYRRGDEKVVVKESKGTDGKVKKTVVKPASTELTFAAIQRLQGFRNAVLRNELTSENQSTDIMLARLAADWARHELLHDYNHFDRVVWVSRGNVPHDKNIRAGEELAVKAETEYEAQEQEWCKRLSAVKGGLFEWLLTKNKDLTTELLCYLASRSMLAAQTQYSKDQDAGASLLDAAQIDMTEHWQPTVEWLSSIQKGPILQILSAFYDKKAMQGLDKLKKGDLDVRAAAMLEGKGYLPAPLRRKGLTAAWAKKAP